MTATATRMQLLEPSGEYLRALDSIKKTPSNRVYTSSKTTDQAFDPSIGDDLLPEIAVSETASTLSLSVPLRGMDARKVFVVASALSILIEVRITNCICHSGFICKEFQQLRLTRELRFQESIVQGSSIVRSDGESLEITCLKGHSADDGAWSELLTLDTRTSLGCVE